MNYDPSYRAEGANYSTSLGNNKYRMRSVFLEIETDEGVTGLSGPFSRHEAFIIDTQLRGVLIGKDPIAIELLWDQMYRSMIHGRKGGGGAGALRPGAPRFIPPLDARLWYGPPLAIFGRITGRPWIPPCRIRFVF